MFNFKYNIAKNRNDALEFLHKKGGNTKILAGGTDVMQGLRTGDLRPDCLLDISRLSELQKIEISEKRLVIGAGVTIAEIGRSDIVKKFSPALYKASKKFAGPQIRNVATIAGNVANSSPGGDAVPPLLIHEAVALIAKKESERILPVSKIASGSGKNRLEPDEMIINFKLGPQPEETGFADFQKVGGREEMCVSKASMAIMLNLSKDKTVSFVRIAVGASTPTPRRFKKIENFLRGKILDEKLLRKAAAMVTGEILDITEHSELALSKVPIIKGLFFKLIMENMDNEIRI